MLQEDYPIWTRYLDKHCEEFLWFYYNVRVGGQVNTDPDMLPGVAKTWYESTAKRIDAIGEKEKEIWIIEVTTRPGFRAIGQVLTYEHLWNLDPKINKPVKNMLVGARLDDDLEQVLKKLNVEYIET